MNYNQRLLFIAFVIFISSCVSNQFSPPQKIIDENSTQRIIDKKPKKTKKISKKDLNLLDISLRNYSSFIATPDFQIKLNQFESIVDSFNEEQKLNFFFLKGLANYNNREYLTSLSYFNECLKIDTENIAALYCSASINFKHISNKQQAEEKFIKIIDIISNIPIEQHDNLYFYQLENDKILGPLYEANNIQFWCNLNLEEINYDNKNIEAAICNLEAALRIRQGEFYTISKLADYNQEIEQYYDAIHYLDLLLPENNSLYKIVFQRGYIYYTLKKYMKAIPDLTLSIEIAKKNEPERNIPNNVNRKKLKNNFSSKTAKSYYFRGLSYGKLEDFKSAISDLNMVIELDTDYEPAYYYRAYFSNYSGNKEQALKDFTKVYELNPNRTDVLYSMALIYDTKSDYDKAHDLYNQFIRSSNRVYSDKYKIALRRVEKLKKHLNK